jgi:hypothetical protein
MELSETKLVMKFIKAVLFARSSVATESFKKDKPKNNKPNPMKHSPIGFNLLFLISININPSPIMGIDNDEMSYLIPNKVIIQAVIVVPILEPIITPIAFLKFNTPAFTKLTTITVVAEDDCMMVVTMVPVNAALNRFEVKEAKIVRNLFPDNFCKASLMNFIPKRKRAKEPIITVINDIIPKIPI